MATKNLYCIVGPSGSGKSTLGGNLRDLGFKEAISHTTRRCRGPEDANAYHFVSEKNFMRMLCESALVEHVRYAGNYYGLSFSALDSSDFAIVEVEGAKAIKKLYTRRPVITVGITANRSVLRQRILDRGGSGLERLEDDAHIFDIVESRATCMIYSTTPADDLKEMLSFMASYGDNLS